MNDFKGGEKFKPQEFFFDDDLIEKMSAVVPCKKKYIRADETWKSDHYEFCLQCGLEWPRPDSIAFYCCFQNTSRGGWSMAG